MVSLSLAKQHLEYDGNDRDSLITQYLNAAAAWVENYTGKKLAVGTVVETIDSFGGFIALHRAPFISLTSIAYTGTDDAAQTVTGARARNGRIYAPEEGWPSTADYTPITVTYQAGYATAPADLDSAQLLLIGHYFASREAAVVGTIASEMPLAVEALCRPYRAVQV
jgi:uncharacterized phiE125 gp8 family phage protein